MKNKRKIINPNKITEEELSFISSTNDLKKNSNYLSSKKEVEKKVEKEKFKKVLLSMPETFVLSLNEYLLENPTEGNKSAFVVRVVAEHIKEKSKNIY